MDRHTFKEKYHMSLGIAIMSSLVVLGEIALGLFQIFNGIITIWNLAPLGMVAFIVYLNVGINKGKSKESREDIAVVDKENQQMESNTIMDTNARISGKQILLRVVLMTVLAGLAFLFFTIAQNNEVKYDTTTMATIVSQENYTQYEVDYSDYYYAHEEDLRDEGLDISEKRWGRLLLAYEYGGEIRFATMEYNVGLAHVENIEICINEEGKFLKSYDSAVRIFYLEAIVFAAASILMVLSLMFLLPMEFMVFDIMALVGASLLLMVNSQFLGNLLYIDLTTFLGLFFFLGVFGLIGSILSKIFNL